MMRASRVLTRAPLRLFQPALQMPASQMPRRHLHLQYEIVPPPGETRQQYCRRVQLQIQGELNKHPNTLLFMSSETRIARPEETLANAAKRHGAATLSSVDLGYVEPRIFTGHCAVAYINEKGELPQERTFSLRPDTRLSPLYKAQTAPDRRLPGFLTSEPTLVRPAIHTTIEQEILFWANQAFYAGYVHPERTTYPLHCFLKPLSDCERENYFKAVKALKASCRRYSLLDHFQEQKLMASENCTLVARLLEWMSPTPVDMKKLLGDNPTPQLVKELMRKQLLQYETMASSMGGVLVTESGDELSKPFMRGR